MQTWRLVRVWIAVGIAWLAGADRAAAQCAQVTAVMSSVARNPVDAARVYSLANLVEGDFYFSDRSTPGSHILVTIPSKFRCAQWIKTPNDDKDQTSLTLVQIQLAQPAVIYVGIDNRAAAGPTWLTSAFTDTGLSIGITETGTQTSFRVWRRKFPAGTAVIGANSAAGSSFPSGKSNYVIFALPDTDNDGLSDREDNCPNVANANQADSEAYLISFSDPPDPAPDGVGDACDNCPAVSDRESPNWGRQHNGTQLDMDHDGVGDTCDSDIDGDGVADGVDNCIYTPNPSQQPGSGAAGAACELPGGLPYEAQGLDVTQVHHFAINMDSLPPRAEVRVQLLPASRNLDVDVDVECSGDPSLQGKCTFGVAGRNSCDNFPRPIAIKARANTIVQPLQTQPQFLYNLSQPQPADGEWVLPFFMYWKPEAFSPLPYLGLVCFVEIRPFPGRDATGTFGVRLEPRTKAPAAAEVQGFGSGFFSADEEPEYGFFTPNGTNFTLLNSGNPTLGQCVIDDPEFGGGHHVAVAGARGWNCCTFTYETSQFDFPHGSGFVSQRGQAAIFVGALPELPKPDQDADLILDFCDNCPTVFNTNQEDADGDGKGDACDNCTNLTNASQLNSDAVPAGDACECVDVNTSNSSNLADVVMMRRYLAGKTNPASFSQARCILASAPFPCDPLAVVQVRRILVGASPPLVQNCP